MYRVAEILLAEILHEEGNPVSLAKILNPPNMKGNGAEIVIEPVRSVALVAQPPNVLLPGVALEKAQ